MNYFITHCDKNYIKYAERLFKSLERYSNYKVLFFSVDFDYENRFKNVINIKFDTGEAFKGGENDLTGSFGENYKSYHVFLKPLLVKNILEGKLLKISGEDNFCYVDSDCFARICCDDIFLSVNRIINHPLLTVACQQFMMMSDGRGNPFANGGVDLNLCLEAPLMKELNIDVNLRTFTYLQTGVFLFNKNCYDFICEWFNLCFSDLIINNWNYLTPFHEETVINCLLWRDEVKDNLKQTLINVIEGGEDQLQLMVDKINNPELYLQRLTAFCTIPARQDINSLYFYHRRVEDSVYNFLTRDMKQYFLFVHSPSLGDTLASTPTLRKLSKSYDSLINVITHNKEIFKNNKYVCNLYSFEEFDRIKSSVKGPHEVFETFLDIGKKNDHGVEKKHATIDIRQFHALDLGFCLSEKEMGYDYIADEYEIIENLPNNYVVLHVGSTWASRTYSKDSWQKLINLLNNSKIPVVLVGKNDSEKGFYDIDKKVINLTINLGIDLTNKLTLSQCWHVINKSEFFVSMDSGLLHLAGSTDAYIIQLGSSINNKLRAPFRENSQDYKYKYISGSCDLFCASDIKYGVKTWTTIQGVPPLINCLENKSSFECHPAPEEVYKFINENNKPTKKKILFLAPHLSTGGSPAYLKWLIEKRISEGCEVKVVEYCLYSEVYIVQRNQIIDLVGKDSFYSFGSLSDSDEFYRDKSIDLINYINLFNPNEIHLNEIAEEFALKPLTSQLKEFLYKKDRTFKIFETCHNSVFNFSNKVLIPDGFDFCSRYHFKISEFLNVPKRLVEMEIPDKVRPNRTEALKKLGLDENCFHVLHVGLFTKDKNQKYIFELAERLTNKNINFHFVGNTCFFDDCGLTENQKNLSNCIIHGEKDNVDDYMAAMDLFVFPSLRELNPICLKEAVAWGMNVFLNKLEVYGDCFDNNNSVTYIKEDNIFKYLNSMETNNLKASEDNNQFNISFEQEAKIEILGAEESDYSVQFFNSKGDLVYTVKLSVNMWASSSAVDCGGKVVVVNLRNNKMQEFIFKKNNNEIINESGSLGDSIAWLPVVNQYAIKNNININYYTPNKNLFDKSKYPLITFRDYADQGSISDKSRITRIGCFNQEKMSEPLQQLVGDILKVNVDNSDKFKPFIDFSFVKQRPFEKKYVCIATHSTAQLKFWNNKSGWKKTVNYLKSLGYEVVCIDRYNNYGRDPYMNPIPKNVIHYPGESLGDIINCLHHCEFMIGLSSGLSWLAWACNKPVVMICGFLNKEYHFDTPYYVQNKNVCNCCWNDPAQSFDKGNWVWCGKNKDFECSKEISFESVKSNINHLRKDFNLI